MEQPVFETRTQVLQWGLLIHFLAILPLVGAAAMTILVPIYAPFLAGHEFSAAELDDLTGTVILWYIGIAWAGYLLGLLRFRRQRFAVYPDRLVVHTGALLGRRVRTYPLSEITRIRGRRSLLGFSRYGAVTLRAGRRRKSKWGGVRDFRGLVAAATNTVAV